MADYEPLLAVEEDPPQTNTRTSRVASLDVFRGFCVFLMMLVDYGGSIFPVIAHSLWNGLHLADFVMPFFLFAAGVSLALVYKKVLNRVEATWKAVLRAVKLFLLGVLLQGGYFHGISSLTYGVDIQTIRWLGILQSHAGLAIGWLYSSGIRVVGLRELIYTITFSPEVSMEKASLFVFMVNRTNEYHIARVNDNAISQGSATSQALCEIWLPCQSWSWRRVRFFKSYNWHWCIALTLSAIYLGLSYGLYVPDWQFRVSSSTTSLLTSNNSYVMVKCSVRGDLSPACNSAGMIDRYVLGVNHLYTKPGYRNLKECNMSTNGQIPETSPSWCQAPFDPEGILSSTTAAVTCLIGLQYGHILVDLQDHKGRLNNWSLFSVSFLALGLFLAFIGIPVNKPLYTVSYMLITSASAGITFCALYLLVDVYGYRPLTSVLEWMGVHSLSIFVLIASNLVVIAIQGFYWTNPENNIIRWIVTRIVHR